MGRTTGHGLRVLRRAGIPGYLGAGVRGHRFWDAGPVVTQRERVARRLAGDQSRRVTLAAAVRPGCFPGATLQVSGRSWVTREVLPGGIQCVTTDLEMRRAIEEHWAASEPGDVEVEHRLCASSPMTAQRRSRSE